MSPVHMPAGRLEVAWTVSARAANGEGGFASAVLRAECRWSEGRAGVADAELVAEVVTRGTRRPVPVPASPTVSVDRRGDWLHLSIADATGARLLGASWERGKLAYCTSAIASIAGLPGGTYDAPTAILECYAAAVPGLPAARAG